MGKYISSTLVNQNFINNLVDKQDAEVKLLKDSFDKFQEKEKQYFFTVRFMRLTRDY